MVYKPQTRVVTRQTPWQALVTEVDPSWAKGKFWGPEYYERRGSYRWPEFMANPYNRGAYNSNSNAYPVGQQFGGVDPLQVPISPTNLGGNTSVGAQSVSFNTTAPIAAGDLILLGIVDPLAPITATQVFDGVNSYRAVRGGQLNVTGAWFSLVWAFVQAAMPAGSAIAYTSSGNPSGSSVLCIAGIDVTGGMPQLPLDTAVTNVAFGTGSAPHVVSGNPQVQKEILVAMAANAGNFAFTQDTSDAWLNLQQFGVGGATPGIIATATKQIGTFDPGTNNQATFAPGQAGSGAWGAMVVGIIGNKPMVQAQPNGGWA